MSKLGKMTLSTFILPGMLIGGCQKSKHDHKTPIPTTGSGGIQPTRRRMMRTMFLFNTGD